MRGSLRYMTQILEGHGFDRVEGHGFDRVEGHGFDRVRLSDPGWNSDGCKTVHPRPNMKPSNEVHGWRHGRWQVALVVLDGSYNLDIYGGIGGDMCYLGAFTDLDTSGMSNRVTMGRVRSALSAMVDETEMPLLVGDPFMVGLVRVWGRAL